VLIIERHCRHLSEREWGNFDGERDLRTTTTTAKGQTRGVGEMIECQFGYACISVLDVCVCGIPDPVDDSTSFRSPLHSIEFPALG
jgi:hypothetical protein